MPQRPNRKCRKPGCPELTRDPSGYCPVHADTDRTRQWSHPPDTPRPTAHQRGYDARWQRYRIAFLYKHPYCGQSPNTAREQAFGCMHYGVVKAATIIDHITPGADAPDLFWTETNHQSLCRDCHTIKTGQDIRARHRASASL